MGGKSCCDFVSASHPQPLRSGGRIESEPPFIASILPCRVHCFLEGKEHRGTQEEGWLSDCLGGVNLHRNGLLVLGQQQESKTAALSLQSRRKGEMSRVCDHLLAPSATMNRPVIYDQDDSSSKSGSTDDKGLVSVLSKSD